MRSRAQPTTQRDTTHHSTRARGGSTRARGAVIAIALLAVVAGCTSDGTDEAPGGGKSDTTLTVLAASSLTETFTDLASSFEAEHPGVEVRLAFDSSATLALQVTEGAPADVLATADAPTMRTIVDAHANLTEPELFATNTMVLIVPADNPAHITRFADLRRDDVTYLACAESAPCGALAKADLDLNNIDTHPASLELDVKSVLNKVVLGEADAGLVYVTDAASAGDKVRRIEIPNSSEAVNSYLVAPLKESAHRDLARAWVELVLSAQGRRILGDAGFGLP